MLGTTLSAHSYSEACALVALRAMQPQRRFEMVVVLEAMAKAFPAKRAASLTLVASNDNPAKKAHH